MEEHMVFERFNPLYVELGNQVQMATSFDGCQRVHGIESGK
jgi:hypothetical protein